MIALVLHDTGMEIRALAPDREPVRIESGGKVDPDVPDEIWEFSKGRLTREPIMGRSADAGMKRMSIDNRKRSE